METLDQYKLSTPLAYHDLEESPEIPVVGVERVQKALAALNNHEASGPNEIPNWLLKDLSEIIAQPITLIISASYNEQRLPSLWKMANVTPLPKTKPIQDLSKNLKTISFTPSLSKVTEGFIVANYIKPAIFKMIDPNQYGIIQLLNNYDPWQHAA